MKLTIYVALLVVLISNLAFTQNQKIKFGDFTEKELNMTSSSIDSEAGATVLSDIGTIWFSLNAMGEFDIIIERHTRIKVFNQEGFDQADIEIPFYTGDDNRVTLSGLKAQTIIPKGGKKFEVAKVEKTAIFDEQYTEFYGGKNFTFPKVNDGVILEYKYRLTTPYTAQMRMWEFQEEIPVMYTELDVSIPQYYDCKVNVVGHSYDLVNLTSGTSNGDDYTNYTYHFIGKNIPALKEEKYSNNIRNFTTKARIVLRSFNIPGRYYKTIAGTYENLNTNLMESDEFDQLNLNNNFLTSELEAVSPSDNAIEHMQNISDYVKSKTSNEYQHYYPNKLARMTLSGSSANSGSINMTLTMMLKKAGYDAEAVILGTRDYLKPHPFSPDRNDFNHLVALVSYKNKQYLFDATSKIKGGFPEIEVYNSEGLVVSKTNSRKIPLAGMGEAKLLNQSKWTIGEEGEVTGEVKLKTNHLGFQLLTDGGGYDSKQYETYLGQIGNKVTEYTQETTKGLSSVSYKLEDEELDLRDIIYFTPRYVGLLDFDIFSREERQTPLDFPFRMNITNILNIQIPAGYTFESGPTAKKINMENDAMSFRYVATPNEKSVKVNFSFKVKETFYLSESYPQIRAFINEIESSLKEKYVFKKIE